VDGRVLPGQSVEAFVREVQDVVGPDVKLVVNEAWEASVFDSRTPLFASICRGIERHHPGAIPVPFMIPGFTDSHAYRMLGATCYGFAPVRLPPGMPFTQMYHGHDERIPRDGFVWGQRLLFEVVRDFASGLG
jgi:acetylornithine deacetylase/succinyl-diaminopimelate desuccinylase-like protein